MKISHLIICQALLLLAFSGCKIGEDSPVRNFYAFDLNVGLDPVKKEYLNGDIFWMSTDIPGKELIDGNTGKVIKVGNGKFTFRVDVFDPFVPPDDSEKFNLAIQSGVVTEIDDFEESGSAIISFGCPANSYAMQIGIQFKEAGGYLVYLNQDNLLPQVVFTEDEDCSLIPTSGIPPDHADVATVYYAFDVDDTNKDVFETYAAGFPGTNVDLDAIRMALDNGEAFFVLVN